jgi:hypothetical protein
MSYLISSDGKTPIAVTNREIKFKKFASAEVLYAYEKTYDDIKKCEWLVNSKAGMISNAKKWDKYLTLPVAREIDNRDLMFIVEPTDEPYYQ